MAIIISSVIGKLKGRSGDVTFRNVKGRNIMSVYPKKINASQTPQAKKARKNFAMTIKFAKSVNSIPALKEIWTAANIEGFNSFQKIIKNNAKLIKDSSVNLSNIITPEGLPISLLSAEVQEKVLKINLFLPETKNIKFPARVIVVFYFEKYNKSVLKIISEIEEPAEDGYYNKDINLDVLVQGALAVDANPIIFAAVAGPKVSKRKIYWTGTAAKQI